jgi:ubiquinone/menaquinone biosynthesis C-methylase UbiE
MISNHCFGRQGRRLAFSLLSGVLVFTACHGKAQERKKDADKLATLLNWQPGSSVAEIGAGDGSTTLAAAEYVGPTGRVYTTELDPDKLAKLQSLAAAQKNHNIIVLKAGQAETNLPHACCDSIFMRRVYHHFTDPEKEDVSLFESLKPGGLLAVIDFQPGEGPGDSKLPKGVPKNRGGHGMPKQLLIEELTAAGFEVAATPTDWTPPDYCIVFKRSRE